MAKQLKSKAKPNKEVYMCLWCKKLWIDTKPGKACKYCNCENIIIRKDFVVPGSFRDRAIEK
jgi:hypothetical protein